MAPGLRLLYTQLPTFDPPKCSCFGAAPQSAIFALPKIQSGEIPPFQCISRTPCQALTSWSSPLPTWSGLFCLRRCSRAVLCGTPGNKCRCFDRHQTMAKGSRALNRPTACRGEGRRQRIRPHGWQGFGGTSQGGPQRRQRCWGSGNGVRVNWAPSNSSDHRKRSGCGAAGALIPKL